MLTLIRNSFIAFLKLVGIIKSPSKEYIKYGRKIWGKGKK